MSTSGIIAAILSGVCLGTVLSDIQNRVRETTAAAIQYQEETVETAEAMGSSSAPAARAQWNRRREIAEDQLEKFGGVTITPEDLAIQAAPAPQVIIIESDN